MEKHWYTAIRLLKCFWMEIKVYLINYTYSIFDFYINYCVAFYSWWPHSCKVRNILSVWNKIQTFLIKIIMILNKASSDVFNYLYRKLQGSVFHSLYKPNSVNYSCKIHSNKVMLWSSTIISKYHKFIPFLPMYQILHMNVTKLLGALK